MPFCLFIVLVSVNLDQGFVQVGKLRVLELASQYQYKPIISFSLLIVHY